MAQKIAITLVLLALFGGAYAATQSFTATTSSFVFAPTTSFSASVSPDSTDMIGWKFATVYAGSATADQAWLYQVGTGTAADAASVTIPAATCDISGPTNCAVYKLYAKKLYSDNYTTYGTNGVAATTSTSSTTNLVQFSDILAITTTTDQVAWASAKTATTPAICVAKSASAPVCLAATAEAQSITVLQLWCDSQNGNCYLLFAVPAGNTDPKTYTYKIFAVTSAGVAVWTTPTTTVFAQTAASNYVKATLWGNSTNSTLNTILNVAFVDCATAQASTDVCPQSSMVVKYNSFLVAAAATATATITSPVTVATNAATSIYIPCGSVTANATNALILCFQNAVDASTPTVYNLTAVFAPSQLTTIAATNLQYLNVTKLTAQFTSAMGTYYGSGFFLVSHAGATTSWTAYYNTYNATGFNLTNGGLTLGTYTAAGSMGNWFISLNSTLGFGYVSYDDGTFGNVATATAGRTISAMAGSIANSMGAGASSGSILASFVAFVALMIASLFAF